MDVLVARAVSTIDGVLVKFEERDSFESLVRRFTRRYPTAGERLHAQRVRLARWRANQLR